MQNKENKNKLTSEDMELIRNDSTFEQKKKEKKADKWADKPAMEVRDHGIIAESPCSPNT